MWREKKKRKKGTRDQLKHQQRPNSALSHTRAALQKAVRCDLTEGTAGPEQAALSLVDTCCFVLSSAIRCFKILYMFVTPLHYEGIWNRLQRQMYDVFRDVGCFTETVRRRDTLQSTWRGSRHCLGSGFSSFWLLVSTSAHVPSQRGLGGSSALSPSQLPWSPSHLGTRSSPVPWPRLCCWYQLSTSGPTWITDACVTSTEVGASVMSVGLAVSLGDS